MPSSSPLFLGLDLGTSGCRAIVIDQQEQIIAQAQTHFSSAFNQDSHQQEPNDWWQAVVNVTQQLAKKINLKDIIALAVDGTSGSVLLCDRNGSPLHNALMYNDARAINEVEQIKQVLTDNGTDNSAVLSATSGLAKLLWLKKQTYSSDAAYFLHQADWINGKLLNRFGDSDVNNTLKSGYDPINKKWPDYFKQLDINLNWLPTVHQPGDTLGTINPSIAKDLGLNSETKIIAGTTDSTAAIMATGVNKIGDAVTSLGSTLVLKIITDKAISNTEYGIYSQPYAGHWLVGGASNSGGAVLKQFFSDKQLSNLTTQLEPDKSTGLKYYPLPATGERFPINDPDNQAVLSPRPENDGVFFQGLLERPIQIMC